MTAGKNKSNLVKTFDWCNAQEKQSRVDVPSAVEVGGDVAAASAALAGLLIVFIGSLSTTFDSYQRQEQGAVRGRYQRRAWFAFVGFVLAILATALGIIGKWLHQDWVAMLAVISLGLTLFWCLLATLFSVLEIR